MNVGCPKNKAVQLLFDMISDRIQRKINGLNEFDPVL